jgi:pyridoxal phosphate enzyme (YggS family)
MSTSPKLETVLTRIADAEKAAGRPAGATTLVAVSKMQAWDDIAPVWEAGHRVYGENRVQEAMTRWTERRADIELRLIGPLQSNKAKEAVGFFDVIETLDREKLISALADEVQKQGKAPRLYVQVNTGEEPQKAGVMPKEADGFIALARKSFEIEGLMCIPPADEPAGPHFALLGKIAVRNGLEKLSMGMSGDFETAVRFGATSVRVGSALFGSRS